MVNALFDPGREGILDDTISWMTGAVKVALIRGYTFNQAHKFVSDITGAGATLVAISAALTGKTAINGVANAAGVTFPAVLGGPAISAILVFQSSAASGGADVAASAQRAISYMDTAINLPVTPNGGDIAIAWDTAVNKIFKL